MHSHCNVSLQLLGRQYNTASVCIGVVVLYVCRCNSANKIK